VSNAVQEYQGRDFGQNCARKASDTIERIFQVASLTRQMVVFGVQLTPRVDERRKLGSQFMLSRLQRALTLLQKIYL
jgi:hypothetical protein